MATKLPKVGFVGLSHLGLVTSTVLASLGVPVVCFDENEIWIEKIKSKQIDILEPGLLDLLSETDRNQIFTAEISELKDCKIIYVSSDVPTDEFNNSDLGIVFNSVLKIASISENIIIVILSQLKPGTCNELSKSIKNNLYYQVETLIFGNAIQRSLKPERLIIGSARLNDNLDIELLTILDLYKCPIISMSYESAELSKIAINAFLASDIALTNTLAEISESIGANWRDIKQALKLDKRIGSSRYLDPGLGIAGGNIERDLSTIEKIGKANSTQIEFITNVKNLSNYHRNWVVRVLDKLDYFKIENLKVGIWGLSYKPNTNSIKNSPSIHTLLRLPSSWVYSAHDPGVVDSDIQNLHINRSIDPIRFLKDVDLLLILTPWDMYRSILTDADYCVLKNKLVIDPYGVLDIDMTRKYKIRHHVIGENRLGENL